MSYILFYLGHIVSIPLNKFDWDWLYPTYKWLMLKSLTIQKKNGKGPWMLKG